ncbi:hypothetical protein [Kitasatospora sp. NPDC091207]|uniref:hypothetical protein n=1 Tax=Kitasatospora sp. NPDC091207 TaxID=3364083 RepID=UPI00381F47CF
MYGTTPQSRVPAEVLARVGAFGGLGAFALGPAGSPADRIGAGAVPALGALWHVGAGVVVPAVRRQRW